MHDGGWFGMGGMGFYGWVPILVVAVVLILVWSLARRRSRGGR